MLSKANPQHQARLMLYAKFIDQACACANVKNIMDLPQEVRNKCWIDAVIEVGKFATNMHTNMKRSN